MSEDELVSSDVRLYLGSMYGVWLMLSAIEGHRSGVMISSLRSTVPIGEERVASTASRLRVSFGMTEFD